jgi:hypothetical protein
MGVDQSLRGGTLDGMKFMGSIQMSCLDEKKVGDKDMVVWRVHAAVSDCPLHPGHQCMERARTDRQTQDSSYLSSN